MYLWGGRWSLSLTPPPSSVSWFYFKMQQAHLSVSFLQRCREIYYTLRDLLHEIGLCIIGAGSVHFSSVQLLSRVRFFVTPWTAAHQGSLSLTISQRLPKFMSVELVMLSNNLNLCCLLLLPSVIPRIRVFSSELALCIRWPKYLSFSFSISPSNEYSGFISLGTNWFDLFCPRNSQESSPTPQFQSINSLVLSLLYGPTLTSIQVYWKNHSFDDMDLCWQSDVFAF